MLGSSLADTMKESIIIHSPRTALSMGSRSMLGVVSTWVSRVSRFFCVE